MTSETKSQATSMVEGTAEWTARELHLMLFSNEELFWRSLVQPTHVLEKLLHLLANGPSYHDSRTEMLRKNAITHVQFLIEAITHVRALIVRGNGGHPAETKTKPLVKWEVQQCFMNSTEYGESLKNGYEPFAVAKEGPYTTVWLKRQTEQPL